MGEHPPIACELESAGQRRREASIRRELGKIAEAVTERENGVEVRFPGSREALLQIAELMAFERICCRFLHFEVVAEAEEGPIWLRISGPDGTRELVRNWFVPAPSDPDHG